jgi:sec-independent protein translocase protein TatC
MSLSGHLRELRRRIIISTGAIVIGAIAGWFLYGTLLHFLLQPYCNILKSSHTAQPCALVARDPLSQLTVHLKLAFFGGFALALPVLLWQTWRFITPGLHPREKRYAVPFVLCSMVLFAFGAAVALITLPYALQFFQSVGGTQVRSLYEPDPYLRLVVLMVVVYGIGFEFPVVLVALLVARVLSTAQLRRWRRGAFVGVVVFAGFFTPSSDPFSMFALAIPMYVFYEASIVVGRLLKR